MATLCSHWIPSPNPEHGPGDWCSRLALPDGDRCEVHAEPDPDAVHDRLTDQQLTDNEE